MLDGGAGREVESGSATSRGDGAKRRRGAQKGKVPCFDSRTEHAKAQRQEQVGTQPLGTPSACTPPAGWGSQAVTLLPARPVCRRLLLILKEARVTMFPFSVLDNPMYWGSTAIYLGWAIRGESQPRAPWSPGHWSGLLSWGVLSHWWEQESILEQGRQTFLGKEQEAPGQQVTEWPWVINLNFMSFSQVTKIFF